MGRVLAFACLLLVAVAVQGNRKPEIQLDSLKRVNNAVFGVDLFRNISRDEKNVFFSPLSVSTLMSQVYEGARGNTRQEMDLLGYLQLQSSKVSIPKIYHSLFSKLKSTSKYTLEIANALITQADFPLLEAYTSTLKRFYGSLIKEVDFVQESDQAVQEVNGWVSEKTHGKIPSLVDKLDQSTRLVLLNAIYFKGTWQTQFEKESTKEQSFYNNGGDNSAPVPMMHLTTRFPFLNDYDRQLKVLQLPYKGNDISMMLVLPYERDGVSRIKGELSDEILTGYLDDVDMSRVIVAIPKFKLEYSRKLKDDFKKAGVSELFDNNADLSGMTGKQNLYVSEVIHKAKIEVNEEGSEAAAVTGGFIMNRIRPMPDVIINEFVADHPFLFYIIHNKSKVILFAGSVDEL